MGIWGKNWPEARAAISGGLPGFVLSHHFVYAAAAVPVFCFHQVPPDLFEQDLKFLQANGYQAIGADALAAHLVATTPAPARAVVLSFDDGAQNLYHVVYPLLRRYDMKAVAFIAPAFHREPGEPPAIDTSNQPPLDWRQLREIDSSGIIDCQSHTFTHRRLSRWPRPAPLEGVDPAYVRWRQRHVDLSVEQDLALAKRTLENKLDKPIRHLAFPCFDGSEAAIRAGTKIGYETFWWGLILGRGLNRPGDSPRRIVRLKGDLLRRLPGRGRAALGEVLLGRLRKINPEALRPRRENNLRRYPRTLDS